MLEPVREPRWVKGPSGLVTSRQRGQERCGRTQGRVWGGSKRRAPGARWYLDPCAHPLSVGGSLDCVPGLGSAGDRMTVTRVSRGRGTAGVAARHGRRVRAGRLLKRKDVRFEVLTAVFLDDFQDCFAAD